MNEPIKKYKNNSNGFLYLVKIAYRNIFRNTRRSVLSMAAVSIAVLLIVFFIAYIEGMMDSIKLIALTFESGHIYITTKEYENKKEFLPLQYPINNYNDFVYDLSKIKGVKKVTARILAYGTFTNSKVKHGIIAGIDINDIKESETAKVKSGFYNYTKKNNGLLIGRYPDENECVIGYRLARKMEIIRTVIEINEFEWLLSNLNSDQKKLFKSSYDIDENLNSYKLNLFKNNKNLSKKEIKKLNKTEKDKYLNLINAFINIDIQSLPEKIGIDSNLTSSLFIVDYIKDEFLKTYKLDEDGSVYLKTNTGDGADKNMLDYVRSAVTIRIPFKILSSQYSDKYADPKLSGIFEYDYVMRDETMLIIPLAKMQKLGSLKNRTQSLYIFTDNYNDMDNVIKSLKAKITDEQLVIKDWTQFAFYRIFKQFEFIYVIIYAIFIIVASFLIINTILMVIHERIKEIGMMGAIGMKRFEIIIVFFLEGFFLSFFGALTGTILGGFATLILSFMPINLEVITGGVDFPSTNTIFVKFSFQILLQGFLFGTVLTSLCTIIPSLKSAFIEPVEALRR